MSDANETYRYFAYKEGSYWRCQELLSVSQIRSMLHALEWRYEVFATIQAYDQYGTILSCPFYFDFDGEQDQVLRETRHFVGAMEFLINVTPRIYFSGNKGFHIIVEKPVLHERCHELVLAAAKDLGPELSCLDKKVYRCRSMFRIPGSPASKPGYYKIEITRSELFNLSMDDIRQLATSQRFIDTQHDPSKFDEEQFQAWMKVESEKLPQYKSIGEIRNVAQSVDTEITPCITRILTTAPQVGERNASVYVLGKFFRSCDVDEDTCLQILFNQPHYKDFEAEGREVTKVIRSIYRTNQPAMIGCKSSSQYASLMRSYCDAPCHFRNDFDHHPFKD